MNKLIAASFSLLILFFVTCHSLSLSLENKRTSVIPFGRSESLKQILCRFLLNVRNERQRVSSFTLLHINCHSHPFHVELTRASLLIRVPPAFCRILLSQENRDIGLTMTDFPSQTQLILTFRDEIMLFVFHFRQTHNSLKFPFSVSSNSISHGSGSCRHFFLILLDFQMSAMKTITAIEWMTRLFSGNKTGKRMRASFFSISQKKGNRHEDNICNSREVLETHELFRVRRFLVKQNPFLFSP